MQITNLFGEKTSNFNFSGLDKKDALKKIAHQFKDAGVVEDANIFLQDLIKREEQGTTGFGEGIAIPHARNSNIKKPCIGFFKVPEGVEWESMDAKPVNAIFVIAMPADGGDKHLEALSNLSQNLMEDDVKASILNSNNITQLKAAFKIVSTDTNTNDKAGMKKVVAVTACPTGIAHTFLARDYLIKNAKANNIDIKVETQGRSTENKLTQEDIEQADVVILAIDKKIDGIDRFNGKRVVTTNTKEAIHKTEKLLKQSLKDRGEIQKNVSTTSDTNLSHDDLEWSNLKSVYKNLMGGVSKMLPFVVAGGILLGLGFLLDIGTTAPGSNRAIAAWFSALGKQGLTIMVTILGGFVAYSIAGWHGFVPGIVAGMLASGIDGGMAFNPGANYSGNWTNMWGHIWPGNDKLETFNSGFIGALVGGYLAGAVTIGVHKMTKNLPVVLQGPRNIIFMPVLTVLFTGVGVFLLSVPLAYTSYGLGEGLKSMNKNNLGILLGIVIGAMMAFDMGGPINKVAYALGTSLIGQSTSQENTMFMGAVMAAGMTPPLGIALATTFFRKQWSESDRQAGYTNYLLGGFFITEGAIPFAAKDPKRVMPSIILGSMVTGGLMYALQIGWAAPHGGIFTIALVKSYLFTSNASQIGGGIALVLAVLAAGSLVTMGMLTLLKTVWKDKNSQVLMK